MCDAAKKYVSCRSAKTAQRPPGRLASMFVTSSSEPAASNALVDLKSLLDLYKCGRLKLDELITERYDLEQINNGFEDMVSGKNARGVVIF